MDLFLCWLVAPLALLLVALGLSLLMERLFELNLPWCARPAMGIAIAIVLAQFGTATATTAKLTLVGIIVLAGLGLVLGLGVVDRRPEWSEVAVAVIVFLLLASPFLVIGEATWGGFIKLDDTATWMALTDHIFQFGRGVGDLPPSTHQQVIADNLGVGYPVGAFGPAALMSKLTGEDVAFTLQPSMAFAVSAMALLLFGLGRRLVRGAGLAAAMAIVASISSILVGYYLWGGVKEMVTAMLLPLAPFLAGAAARAGWPKFAWVPIGFAVAATIAVLAPGGAVWVLPTLLPAVIVLWRNRGFRGALRIAWRAAACSLVLVLPVLIAPSGFFDPLSGGLTETSEIGNLIKPLNPLQIAGIWPSLDFRIDPHLKPAVLILAVLCLLIAAAATAFSARLGERDGIPLVGYVGGGVAGGLVIILFGSPWVDGKVLASLSPAVLFAALVGIAMVYQRSGFRLEAAALGTVVVGAVAWSAFLGYQGTWFAPRGPMTELEKIGEKFAGEGPALSTESSIYGPRHFLRNLDAEGASDRRHNLVLLRNGSTPEKGQAVDLDEIQPEQLDPYNLLVTRRSPAASRPPADFGLAYAGKYYDVWQRQASPGTLVEHLSLGDSVVDDGAVPACSAVQELAAKAGPSGTLVAAKAADSVAVDFSQATEASGWSIPSSYSAIPSGSGDLVVNVSVAGGPYQLWIGGSIFGGLSISVDGHQVASERAVVAAERALTPLGTVDLAPGEHQIELSYSGASLYPGSGTSSYGIGPLLLDHSPQADLGTVTVTSGDYRQLCGKRWDWVEAYE